MGEGGERRRKRRAFIPMTCRNADVVASPSWGYSAVTIELHCNISSQGSLSGFCCKTSRNTCLL